MTYKEMCQKYNLPDAGSCPYEEFIVQLPFTFEHERKEVHGIGRSDLTATFRKVDGKWQQVTSNQ